MGTHPIFESDFDCLTEMTNWTHRFELKIPSSKIFYHYEYLYIPVEENNKHNGSKIRNNPFNVMAMFMGLPRDEFRNVIYPKYDFNVFKLGILKTIAETPATLIYHDDFSVPEGDNGEYVQDTLDGHKIEFISRIKIQETPDNPMHKIKLLKSF